MAGSKQDDKEQQSEIRRANPAIGFGTSFAVGMALFGLGGHWLDEKYDREPLFTLLGLFMGLLYGGWELWKLTAQSSQPSSNQKSQGDKAGEQHNDARKP